MSDVIFYNIIHLPEGDDSDALAAWSAVGDWMEKQDGFLGSTLYRNKMNPKTLINRGRYSSEEAFMASVKNPEFQALSQKLNDLGVKREAGLYDVVKSFADGAE